MVDVFWAKGFHGASYADLVAATGMNRPSLYAAFGDKEELFLQAVGQCARAYALPAAALLEGEGDVRSCFREFFAAMVGNALLEGHPGCLITTVLGEASSTSSRFQTRLAELVEAGDLAIRRRLERAVAEGELEPGRDLAALARLINSFVMSFAVRARAGEAEATLRAGAQAALPLLLG